MCKKQESNIRNNIAENPKPGTRVLTDCLLNATISLVFEPPPDIDTKLEKKIRKLRDHTISAFFEKEVMTLMEIEDIPKQGIQFPDSAGVYILYDSAPDVLYIGQAKSFKYRIPTTLKTEIPVAKRFGPDMERSKPTISDLVRYISLYQIDNKKLRHNIEALLIRVFINQTHNTKLEKFQ